MNNRVQRLAFSVLPVYLIACQSLSEKNNQGMSSEQDKPHTVAATHSPKKKNQKTPLAEPAESPAVDISHKYQYKVRGKRYKVFASSKNFQQIGDASWYGPGFHGKRTANGEIYNMHAMTAAHKTLPLGCKVKVTNLINGRKITVRINDRGPFHGGRIIDLSKAAAKKLGILGSGYAKVHVKIIE